MPDSKLISEAESTIEMATGGADGFVQLGPNALMGLVRTSELVPSWWSPYREHYLSRAWKVNNHLGLAVYNAQSKLVALPPRIRARDETISLHVRQAERMTSRLQLVSQFGKGWLAAAEPFYEDLLTQDNGAFLEIIGDGQPDGPIIGAPIAVRHLDSQRCMRTGDPIYPVVFMDEQGRRWKMHWTRVIFMAQQPSSRSDMNGVGFCAVSRSLNIAQTLHDMINYKMERLGSRPVNKMLVGRGIKGEEIALALQAAMDKMDAADLSRYSKIVAIGSSNTDIGIDEVNLTHMDPFDEEVGTRLGMYAIAAAFGMDISEIWVTSGGRQAQAEARIQNARSRGKLPAQVSAALAAQFNLKFVPPHLYLEFDFQDDEEDQQRAMIRDIRSRNRLRDLESGTLDERSARMWMVADGDLERSVFVGMELSDGRLEDGTPIEAIFFDPSFSDLVSLPMTNPLNIYENEAEDALSAIAEAKAEVYRKYYAGQARTSIREKIHQAIQALDWLEKKYVNARISGVAEEEDEDESEQNFVSENARNTAMPRRSPSGDDDEEDDSEDESEDEET